MKKLIYVLFLGITALWCSCENGNKEQGDKSYTTDTVPMIDTNVIVALPSDSIFFEEKEFNKKSDNCTSDTANCASFVATFPLIETRLHGKTADSINNLVREKLYSPLYGDKVANGLNDLLAPYFAAYKEAQKEAQLAGEEYTVAWYFDRKFEVVNNSYWLFTIKHSEYSFAGGAKPNSFENYYNFNPVSGQRLYTRNVFKPATIEKLRAMAEKKFRKSLALASSTSLEEEGFWFKDNVFALTENFLIDNKGIHFLFNPYEVAPGAVGEIKITFKYAELKGMLNDIFDPENRTTFDKNHTPVGRY